MIPVPSAAFAFVPATQWPLEQKFRKKVGGGTGKSIMQAAIDRIMYTYGMIANLTLEQERAMRESVSAFLSNSKATDENQLAIEGIRYLRGDKPSARRRV